MRGWILFFSGWVRAAFGIAVFFRFVVYARLFA